jgi:hypothetical protein
MSPRQYLNNRDFRRWGSAYRRSCGRRGAGKELKAPRRGFFTSQTSLPIHRFHRVPTAHVDAGWCGSETYINRSLTRLITLKPRASLLAGLRCGPQRPYHEDVVVRNFAVTDDTGTARLRQCWRHRQPRAVVRERPPPDPTISASAILLAQGVPESLPIYFRDLHIVRALADLLIHFGHFLKYLRLSPRIERRRS